MCSSDDGVEFVWSGDAFNNADAMVPIVTIAGVHNGISKVRDTLVLSCTWQPLDSVSLALVQNVLQRVAAAQTLAWTHRLAPVANRFRMEMNKKHHLKNKTHNNKPALVFAG